MEPWDTYLLPLLHLCEHDNGVALPLPHHPPEILHGVWQRPLRGNEIILLAIALQRKAGLWVCHGSKDRSWCLERAAPASVQLLPTRDVLLHSVSITQIFHVLWGCRAHPILAHPSSTEMHLRSENPHSQSFCLWVTAVTQKQPHGHQGLDTGSTLRSTIGSCCSLSSLVHLASSQKWRFTILSLTLWLFTAVAEGMKFCCESWGFHQEIINNCSHYLYYGMNIRLVFWATTVLFPYWCDRIVEYSQSSVTGGLLLFWDIINCHI